jgi:hypothetical protein
MLNAIKTRNHHNNAIPHNLQETKKRTCKEKLSTKPFLPSPPITWSLSLFGFQQLMWWCFIHLGFHHPNFVSEWLLFFFRNPYFLSHSIWWKFSLCALDEWDQIPCVVPCAVVDECDLVPCAVSTIPPTTLHHKRLRGCHNCEKAFFVRANFQQMAIFSIKLCIFQALKCARMLCKRVKPSSFDLKKVGRIHMPSIWYDDHDIFSWPWYQLGSDCMAFPPILRVVSRS